MSRIKRLLNSYETHIKIPWRQGVAPPQRVIFCVYDPAEETKIRVHFDEFAIVTKQAGYKWESFDLTNTFADWLAGQRYANKYFTQPNLINPVMHRYLEYIETEFTQLLADKLSDEDTVVALKGVGSLFGLIKVKDLVDKLSPLVVGRLLVFFPGSYDENNNYRLLDAYDGWNYLAVPITSGRD